MVIKDDLDVNYLDPRCGWGETINVKRKCKIMCQFMFYFENFLRIGCLTALKGVGNWNVIQGWG